MKLGFIGLGAMGAPMARNLLKAGHELAVWNRSSEKVVPLVEVGARRADSPADAASGTRATILMVTNAEAVHEVLFGDKMANHTPATVDGRDRRGRLPDYRSKGRLIGSPNDATIPRRNGSADRAMLRPDGRCSRLG